MKKPSETILFFGSGPVAAASLEFLAKNFNIEAVVTKPRPAHHKGSVPVLETAEKIGLKIYTAPDKTSLDTLIGRANFQSRLGIIVDFGVIVSKKVIDYFPLGIINSHFSLLPEWRGADPITFAILSGQKRTGVSLMLIVEKLDEGDLLAQTPYDIPENDSTPTLTNALVEVSNNTLLEIIPLWLSQTIQALPQQLVTLAPSDTPTYSRKITKEDGIIDWSKPADVIDREVRAFIEWPKSRTVIANKEIIITKAYVVPGVTPNTKPGDFEIIRSAGVIGVTTSNDTLYIERLKPAGKPQMSAQAFIAGYGDSFRAN